MAQVSVPREHDNVCYLVVSDTSNLRRAILSTYTVHVI